MGKTKGSWFLATKLSYFCVIFKIFAHFKKNTYFVLRRVLYKGSSGSNKKTHYTTFCVG